jgi:hypothetical protein
MPQCQLLIANVAPILIYSHLVFPHPNLCPSFTLWGSLSRTWIFLCTVINTASSAAPQIPLCRRMLDRTQDWRLRHWQSDALTTRLDLIHLPFPQLQFSSTAHLSKPLLLVMPFTLKSREICTFIHPDLYPLSYHNFSSACTNIHLNPVPSVPPSIPNLRAISTIPFPDYSSSI